MDADSISRPCDQTLNWTLRQLHYDPNPGTPMGLSESILPTVAVIFISAFGVARFRTADAVATSQNGAAEAIAQVRDWSKWMSTLLTAVIGGMAAMVFDIGAKPHPSMEHPGPHALAFSAAGLLSVALFCSSLVLCSLPAHTLRIYGGPVVGNHEVFDIYRQPLYARWPKLRLGDLLVLTHVLWTLGLVAVVGLLLYLM
jgi:hypothetical protein